MSVEVQRVHVDSDAAVIARSLADPELFGELFDRHWSVVYRYCRSRAAGEGEDLAAETFRLAFDRRAAYDLDRPDARPWLLGLATNLIRNHLRSCGRGERAVMRLSPPGAVDDPTDLLIEHAEAALLGPKVAEALEGIPGGDRDALLLMVWNDLSYDEVAEALGVPAGTVASRISRARLRLRARLAELGSRQDHARSPSDH
jgi:RNA polymerase sigma factor (sigma-70 family)